jgi:hypothetical protein
MAHAAALAIDLSGAHEVDPALTQQPLVLVQGVDGRPAFQALVASDAHGHVRLQTFGADDRELVGPARDQRGAQAQPHERMAARGDVQTGPLRHGREIGEDTQDGGRVGDHASAPGSSRWQFGDPTDPDGGRGPRLRRVPSWLRPAPGRCRR